MHLDNELKALRPEVGRPSATTVSGHRRALDAAIAEGRTERGRGPRYGDGRPRWVLAMAAVLALVVAGGATWWATTRSDENVRLDTGPAGSPGNDGETPATVTAPSGATLGAPGAGQSTPTVTFAPDTPLACGPDSPAGDTLPGPLQILPDETGSATGSTTFDADGRAVIRRENERYAVEALWPAPDRVLYAKDRAADAPDATNFGNVSMHSRAAGGYDVVVEREVGDVTPLSIVASGTVKVAATCRYVLFTVSERGQAIARFTYDLTAEGGAAMVDRAPLVVETRQVAEAPADAVPCDGGPGAPPNDDEPIEGPVAATPAEALDAYLATPAADFFYHSGFVELITPDGTHTYGAPFDGVQPDWVTLVTVEAVDGGGWAATHLTASGC